ncbi:SDR family oxidoreductase [Pontibacillus yanchengensis]|uniref:SDR family oxidoreductase n=2 Tax=Pontibacillus yanchengensis TaxID=462910 RepID=A0ACC7VD72_9BACI|nr:SDR family oxidoreductase [Pontibacillus yanchengensis]MYL32271.1 SDR family oxidoreductase [Pontibacillus yanchengensis]MYL52851.1 SDR family oxidoreductase [Pontibacillus yanchengensis]
MSQDNSPKTGQPPQTQNHQPGFEYEMQPLPEYIASSYKASGKLTGKVAIITGGDSGIGRAISVHYAREGASVAIVYLNEHADAKATKALVEKEGQQCLLISGDIGNEAFCETAVRQTISQFGKLDIVVNNAAEQHPQSDLTSITSTQLERTFRTNVFGYFYMTKAALPNLNNGSSIINTCSVTAYHGSKDLLDYSSTKGAITAFTRSLSENIVNLGIRVNGVAPGPIWTPLIPSSFDAQKVSQFGTTTPMKRAGQPKEVAPIYVFLASEDASYMSGQMVHINGGMIVNG